MPIFAIAAIPLINRLSEDTKQVWYADDIVGTTEQLCVWWDKLVKLGPGFSYFPNALKTWLVTKDKHR